MLIESPGTQEPARKSREGEHGDPVGRAPGQHARATVLRLRLRTLVALGLLAVVTAGLGRAFGLHSALFIASELALLASMFGISRWVLPLVDRRDRGAAGEEQVGKLLEELAGQGWHVIHDVTLDHGNVDHIAIGPAGLFTIETKSHPGPVRVGRIHGATFRQAQAQRQALERLTGERVEPLIVYSRAWVDKPLARRRGVRVMPARMLVGYLERQREQLTGEQIAKARRRVSAALAESCARGGRLHSWQPQSLRRR